MTRFKKILQSTHKKYKKVWHILEENKQSKVNYLWIGSDVFSKDFKKVVNMFKELKETIFKELKKKSYNVSTDRDYQ